jgi:DNA-binding YbaB/EbfC family protein
MTAPFDINAMLQQAQQMQEKLVAAQSEAANKTVEASAGGGMVQLVMTGGFEVRSVKIDPNAIDPKDLSLLQDLVIAAVNQAITKAKEMQAEAMRSATGGLPLPGLPF